MSAGGGQTLWVDSTLDLMRGCRPKNDECRHCPACAFLRQHGLPTGVAWPSPVSEWEKVHQLKPGSLVLLCSESDPFLTEAMVHWQRIHQLLLSRPDVTFLALTKQLENARKWTTAFGILPNLWLGTSAGRQESFNEFVPQLFDLPATGYVLSLQPLLSPIELGSYLRHTGLKLVVCGCELGKHARRCPLDWLDQVRDQCRGRVPHFRTRWQDRQGKVHTAGTWNGRGGNRKDRPGFNPRHRRAPTILSLLRELS